MLLSGILKKVHFNFFPLHISELWRKTKSEFISSLYSESKDIM